MCSGWLFCSSLSVLVLVSVLVEHEVKEGTLEAEKDIRAAEKRWGVEKIFEP